MKTKLIKSEEDYGVATSRVEELMELEDLTTDQMDELELLAVLIERYEEASFPVDLPSPIDAIRFRMDQMGLKQVDVAKYFGSKSKASEVLSGKRSLSLQMIRKLNAGLGIPAEVLLQEPGAKLPDDRGIDWDRFPIAEMKKRGWFPDFTGTIHEAKRQAEELISEFARGVGLQLLEPVFLRQGNGNTEETNGYSIAAWRVHVCKVAKDEKLPRYVDGTVTTDFARELVSLSYLDDGPVLAKEFLNKNGIHLIVERHFEKTYLDGAAMFSPQGQPIIALTLRYDRLDNFWFTLCHELGHLALHLRDDNRGEAFFDNLDAPLEQDVEKEADAWATDVLISEDAWRASGLSEKSSPAEVSNWAKKARICAAVPAGRIRKMASNYRLFSTLVGQGKVRKMFLNSGW